MKRRRRRWRERRSKRSSDLRASVSGFICNFLGAGSGFLSLCNFLGALSVRMLSTEGVEGAAIEPDLRGGEDHGECSKSGRAADRIRIK